MINSLKTTSDLIHKAEIVAALTALVFIQSQNEAEDEYRRGYGNAILAVAHVLGVYDDVTRKTRQIGLTQVAEGLL